MFTIPYLDLNSSVSSAADWGETDENVVYGTLSTRQRVPLPCGIWYSQGAPVATHAFSSVFQAVSVGHAVHVKVVVSQYGVFAFAV